MPAIVSDRDVQPGEWLLAFDARSQSADVVTITGATALPSGTVLGRITATGKLAKYSNAASDGTSQAVAVLQFSVPGVNGNHKAFVIDRDAEVMGSRLNGRTGLDAPGQADLRALGVIVR